MCSRSRRALKEWYARTNPATTTRAIAVTATAARRVV
jgi:hypothetical protein